LHEWSLAEALVKTVINETKNLEFKKISEIKIAIGRLQNIDKKIIKYAIKELSKKTPLENAKIILNEIEASFKCRNCNFKWRLRDVKIKNREEIHFFPELVHAFSKCPNCGSSDFEILSGRKIWIENIKILK